MRFTNPLGPTVLAPTSEVTLAAGTEVRLATGTIVSLPAGTEVGVVGASSTAQSAPAFAGRTVSAGSTAHVMASTASVWYTLIPAPSSSEYLELHSFCAGKATTTAITTSVEALLSTSASTTGLFAEFVGKVMVFDFQGATLGAGEGVYLKGYTNAQLNYAVK